MGDRWFASIDYFQNGASDFDEILHNAYWSRYDGAFRYPINPVYQIRPLLAILFSGFYLVFGDYF